MACVLAAAGSPAPRARSASIGGEDATSSSRSALSPCSSRAAAYTCRIERLSRMVPPRSAATTRAPASSGASATIDASSVLKPALGVISERRVVSAGRRPMPWPLTAAAARPLAAASARGLDVAVPEPQPGPNLVELVLAGRLDHRGEAPHQRVAAGLHLVARERDRPLVLLDHRSHELVVERGGVLHAREVDERRASR